MLTNILTIISIVVTVVGIIITIKNNPSPAPIQVAEVHVIKSSEPSHQKESTFADTLIIAVALFALGKKFYPYREIMTMVFSIFWWVVVVIATRLSKKHVVGSAIRRIIIILLLEAVANMAGLIFIDKLPPELFSTNFIPGLYLFVMMGYLTASYGILLFLGICLVGTAISNPKFTKLSETSSRLLYRYHYLPVVPLAAVIVMPFLIQLARAK